MHRAAVAVEQAGPGEQVAAGGECAEAATAAALAAQGGDHRRIAQALDCEAGNHDQEVEAPAVVEPRLGEQMHAAGGMDRLAVGGQDAPVVERLSGKPVGSAQRLHRRAERQHGELRRSEEHKSELQSLMRISYAVFCLKKKNTNN